MVVVLSLYYLNFNYEIMKIKRALYDIVLAEVLDTFGIEEQELFYSNREQCVEARMTLVVTLSKFLSDSDIALLTPMRRCSICAVRNKYCKDTAPWSVKKCLEILNEKLKE